VGKKIKIEKVNFLEFQGINTEINKVKVKRKKQNEEVKNDIL
jgi:hypothetical protein